MTIRRSLTLLLFWALACAASGAKPVQVALQSVSRSSAPASSDHPESFPHTGTHRVPNRLIESSAGEIRFSVTLGDVLRNAIIRKSDRDFRWHLQFDCNGNGNLTDDLLIPGESVVREPGENFDPTMFRQVPIEVSDHGTSAPCLYSIRIVIPEPVTPANPPTIILSSDTLLLGEARIANENLHFMLGDGDCDGSIRSRGTLPPDEWATFLYTGDTLSVSSSSDFHYLDHSLFPTHVVVAGELYAMDVRRAEAKLILTPLPTSTTLTMRNAMTRALVISNDNQTVVHVRNSSGKVPFPPGDYRIAHYLWDKPDRKNQLWRVIGRAAIDGPVVAASESSSSVLEIAEPFRSRVIAIPRILPAAAIRPFALGQDGIIYDLSWKMTGAAGETIEMCGPVSVPTDDFVDPAHHAEPPRYKIISQSGEVVAHGRFEYG